VLDGLALGRVQSVGQRRQAGGPSARAEGGGSVGGVRRLRDLRRRQRRLVLDGRCLVVGRLLLVRRLLEPRGPRHGRGLPDRAGPDSAEAAGPGVDGSCASRTCRGRSLAAAQTNSATITFRTIAAGMPNHTAEEVAGPFFAAM